MDFDQFKKNYADLTPEKVAVMTVEQGLAVLQVLETPGWKLIEKQIDAIQKDTVRHRTKVIRLNSTRENSLYWDGVFDGVEDVKEAIYYVVKKAFEVKAAQEQSEQGGNIE